MEYYYTASNNIRNEKLYIVEDEAEHLFKVLRKKEGSEIFVTDGEYNVYKCNIIESGKYKIVCSILEKYFKINESDIKIYLYPALLRNHDRFEYIIEKAVEIGVYEISPVITDRVINKEWNKRDRWQSIALSAMKQSQRCYLPIVNEPCELKDVINKLNSKKLCFIGHEDENKSISIHEFKKLAGSADECSIITGPEGGFSTEELLAAENNSFKFIKLGNRKMRSETAAMILSALVIIN